MKIQVGRENSTAIELQGADLGHGPPVLLLHGWPLASAVWERQVSALLAAGHRVISYDRRGCGQSSKPTTGYDFDTLAEDLHRVMEALDLHDCSLVGFAMGCGELARYLGSYGADRVRCAVFIAPLPPCLRQSADNPLGLDVGVFDGLREALQADRHGFLQSFLRDCYNHDGPFDGPLTAVGEATLHAHWLDALQTSHCASLALLEAWQTDFRDDLPRIAVPSLVLQGSADHILPPSATGEPLAVTIAGARLALIDGAPHGLTWTHADAVNTELIAFVREAARASASTLQG